MERLPHPAMVFTEMSLAPDGRRLLASVISRGEYNLRVLDLERGTREDLAHVSNSMTPRWHPDGMRLAFTSSRNGTFDGFWQDRSTGQPESNLIISELDVSPRDFTPDGKQLVFMKWTQETNLDLWLLDLESQDQKPLVTHRSSDSEPRVSPDGNWLAYESLRSGVPEVYVERILGSGPAVKVSTQGGSRPVWSPGGGELFFRFEGRAMVATYRTSTGSFEAEPPVPFVPESDDPLQKPILSFEASSDGRRLLVVVPEQERRAGITVVTDGFGELLNNRH